MTLFLPLLSLVSAVQVKPAVVVFDGFQTRESVINAVQKASTQEEFERVVSKFDLQLLSDKDPVTIYAPKMFARLEDRRRNRGVLKELAEVQKSAGKINLGSLSPECKKFVLDTYGNREMFRKPPSGDCAVQIRAEDRLTLSANGKTVVVNVPRLKGKDFFAAAENLFNEPLTLGAQDVPRDFDPDRGRPPEPSFTLNNGLLFAFSGAGTLSTEARVEAVASVAASVDRLLREESEKDGATVDEALKALGLDPTLSAFPGSKDGLSKEDQEYVRNYLTNNWKFLGFSGQDEAMGYWNASKITSASTTVLSAVGTIDEKGNKVVGMIALGQRR